MGVKEDWGRHYRAKLGSSRAVMNILLKIKSVCGCAYVSVYATCMCMPRKRKGVLNSFGSGVTGDFETYNIGTVKDSEILMLC